MSRKKRFIENLDSTQIAALEAGTKSNIGYQFSQRCHVILLSYKGYEIKALMDIFNVSRNTIYGWFDRWEKEGIEGLKNKPGRGRKPTLSVDNAEHVKVVKKALKNTARKGTNLLAEIEAELDLEEKLTMHVLRPFLKKLISYGKDSGEG